MTWFDLRSVRVTVLDKIAIQVFWEALYDNLKWLEEMSVRHAYKVEFRNFLSVPITSVNALVFSLTQYIRFAVVMDDFLVESE